MARTNLALVVQPNSQNYVVSHCSFKYLEMDQVRKESRQIIRSCNKTEWHKTWFSLQRHFDLHGETHQRCAWCDLDQRHLEHRTLSTTHTPSSASNYPASCSLGNTERSRRGPYVPWSERRVRDREGRFSHRCFAGRARNGRASDEEPSRRNPNTASTAKALLSSPSLHSDAGRHLLANYC